MQALLLDAVVSVITPAIYQSPSYSSGQWSPLNPKKITILHYCILPLHPSLFLIHHTLDYLFIPSSMPFAFVVNNSTSGLGILDDRNLHLSQSLIQLNIYAEHHLPLKLN